MLHQVCACLALQQTSLLTPSAARLRPARVTQKDQPCFGVIAQELASSLTQESLLLPCHGMAHRGLSPLYFARC